MTKLLILILAVTFQLQSFAKLPDKAFQTPKLVAIQNKSNYLDKDISFEFGVLPSDAFNKGVSLGSSYTHFFSQYQAWEVINFKANFNIPTSLKKDLLDLNVDVTNNEFEGKLDPIQFILTTNYVYTPLYSKSLLFNSQLVNSETSFLLGGGTVKFKDTGYQLLFNVGAYSRYFTDIGRSWKFDFRWNFHFGKAGSGNFLFLGVSYSMQLGDAPSYLLERKAIQ